jgi:hypothetical protein
VEEILARLEALEERVYGIGYGTAVKMLEEAKTQVQKMSQQGMLDLITVMNPDLTRAREVVANVRRFLVQSK